MPSLTAVLAEARQPRLHRTPGPSQVAGLIAALRAEGVEPTDATTFDRLLAVGPPSTAMPTGLLGLDAKRYADLAVERALSHHAKNVIQDRLHGQRSQLAAEMADSMRAEVDDYLARLAPTFAEAAEQAHRLVHLGVSPTDQPADLLRRSPDVVAAALLFQDKHSAVLDRVASVRVQLSLLLGIEPGRLLTDHGAAFMTPHVPGLFDPRRVYTDGWRRWIDIAERAELRLLGRAEVAATAALIDRQRLVVEDDEGRLVTTA